MLPNSSNHADYVQIISTLPAVDTPGSRSQNGIYPLLHSCLHASPGLPEGSGLAYTSQTAGLTTQAMYAIEATSCRPETDLLPFETNRLGTLCERLLGCGEARRAALPGAWLQSLLQVQSKSKRMVQVQSTALPGAWLQSLLQARSSTE